MIIEITKDTDSVADIVRKMDVPDNEIVEVYRDGVLVFNKETAAVWKSVTVSETASGGIKFKKYKPFVKWFD